MRYFICFSGACEQGDWTLNRRASAIEPDSPGIYFNMGVVYERMGDRARAIEHYERALALDPGYIYPAERIRFLQEGGGSNLYLVNKWT
ncbi:MAG: tetratricopeptide repeat protein [Thermodesulfovibrionales bacterium]|nr:tetratricopeptide repeat protein [Thermodesulfovibrionales bacterium]